MTGNRHVRFLEGRASAMGSGYSILQLHASTARGGPEGTTGPTATRRCANDDERLHSGSQRTETGSPFQHCKNGAGLEKNSRCEPTGHLRTGTCGNFRRISWLMVGAIGFEPMTS